MLMIIKNVKVSVKDELNNDLSFEYSLLKVDFKYIDTYGFKISKIDKFGKLEDSEEVLGVTEDLKYAEEIFFYLVEFKALPLHLINILDDFIT